MSNECIFELGEGVEKRPLKVGIPTGNRDAHFLSTLVKGPQRDARLSDLVRSRLHSP